MGTDELNEMGPIDYLLIEWPGRQPTGEVAPHVVDLVDRGLIRILDLALIAKGEDGSVARLEIADVGGEVEEFAVFEGASSGLLSERTPKTRPGRWSREPPLRCWITRIDGPLRLRLLSGARAASSSRADESPCKPSSPPSTRLRQRPRR